MATIPLEDELQDIIGKARRGLKLTESQLAVKAGLPLETLEALQKGSVDPEAIAKVARALRLDAPALLEIARGSWQPARVNPPATFAMFDTTFDGMRVNSYLVWERDGGPAAVFDTGGECAGMLEAIREHRLKVEAIFLTHTHIDHVARIDDLVNRTGASVYVSEFEKLGGTVSIEDGRMFTVGGLRIGARLTAGHSVGGTTYVVEGLRPAIAIVGDALFCGSMGGVPPDRYEAALRMNREQILSLADDTIVCPGHGPMSTVGEEKRHNPFYAAGA